MKRKKSTKTKAPQYGARSARRITYDGWWNIEEYVQAGRGYFFGLPCVWGSQWRGVAKTRTLWGLKREWLKRYGATVSFPQFSMTVWEDPL